jgi:carbon-monoxide dehydrogenase large subunit
MEIRFDPSGGVTVLTGTFSHGQGHETVFPQLVADWLGVPMDRIRLVQGDTDRVSYGRGTYASRSMTIGGSALRAAADDVIEKGKLVAGHLLEAAADDIEFSKGRFSIAGTDRSVTIETIARAAHAPAGMPASLDVGLEGRGSFAPTAPNYPNGCHICEVEIDPETGQVEIQRYSAVDDVGRAVNPLLLAGQVHGGVAQGIGQALMEHIVFDPGSGQMLTASFLDYAMPRANDLPQISFDHHDIPCLTNPLGVKGAGEAGCVGAPPAVMNAIFDALRPLGIKDIKMPATAERVWRAIRGSPENG